MNFFFNLVFWGQGDLDCLGPGHLTLVESFHSGRWLSVKFTHTVMPSWHHPSRGLTHLLKWCTGLWRLKPSRDRLGPVASAHPTIRVQQPTVEVLPIPLHPIHDVNHRSLMSGLSRGLLTKMDFFCSLQKNVWHTVRMTAFKIIQI